MINHLLLKRTRSAMAKKFYTLRQFSQASNILTESYEKKFTVTNQFWLVRHPLYSNPFISVSDKFTIPILEGKTIGDIEAETKNLRSGVCFYSHDNAKIAKSNPATLLLDIPYFKLVVNDSLEYVVISEKSFSFQNHKYELNGNSKSFYDYCKNIPIDDDKAVLLSRYSSTLFENLAHKKTWTKDEFLDESIQSLSLIASNSSEEKDVIHSQRDILKKHRKPMDDIRGNIERDAELYAKRRIFTIFYIIASQYLLVQYGTYIMFSWDIMEPITCAMTLGDAVIAYIFWCLTKNSYSISGVYDYFYKKRLRKLEKKENFDRGKYDLITTTLAVLKKRLNELK